MFQSFFSPGRDLEEHPAADSATVGLDEVRVSERGQGARRRRQEVPGHRVPADAAPGGGHDEGASGRPRPPAVFPDFR